LDYLPLKDLLATIQRLAPCVGNGDLFDYGCGGAPYRGLFAHCSSYIGADLVPGPNVDKILDASGLTSEPDAAYDIVLSSQVLEHVPDPARYLAEAFRILKPGGHLILTTHGMFLEHGCPNDFYRWTGYGLEKNVSAAGFHVLETLKITPGTRASIYLINAAIDHAGTRHHWLPHVVIAIFRRTWAVTLRPLLHWLTGALEPRPTIPGTAPEAFYIGVGILAQKP
jgi:SAM-dependent methyltransferase